jgi:hypothetical protein
MYNLPVLVAYPSSQLGEKDEAGRS